MVYFYHQEVAAIVRRVLPPSHSPFHDSHYIDVTRDLNVQLTKKVQPAVALFFCYKKTTMAPLQARMNVACKLLNDEKYTECAAEMKAMLRIYELPRYYHIKCRIILASTQDDWYDAETHRAVAEELWGHYRHTWPPGNDSVIDGQFNELRMLLDELKEAQDSDRPDDYYEFCDAELTNGESKDDTESAEAEDEGTIYFAEAEDEVEVG